jgi:uncharacterized DUF497 family protein
LINLYITDIYNTVDELNNIVGFDWDEGNSRKNADKHDVTQQEGEQLFFNEPLLVVEDESHSQQALRFHALGHTGSKLRLQPIVKTCLINRLSNCG